MTAQQSEPVATVDPQRGVRRDPSRAQRHPGRLVERVDAVGGLGRTAYVCHDVEARLAVAGTDAYDAQRRCSAGVWEAAPSGAASFGSFDGSTKR